MPDAPSAGVTGPGDQPVLGADGGHVSTLAEFWRWSSSNLLDNTLRGLVAEYLVGLALECVDGRHRTEWDAYDLVTTDGITVEVKSSAYLQSWVQEKVSAIRFGVGQRTSWDAATNTYAEVAGRAADVYVFCLFHETDRERANPLDTRQWTFFVAPTSVLDSVLGTQKSIALGSLITRIRPTETTFAGLPAAVREMTMPRDRR